MTDTANAPLFQASIVEIDQRTAKRRPVSNPTLAFHAIRGVHRSLNSLRTVPEPQPVDPANGVWLVLLPAGMEAQLAGQHYVARRAFVSGATYLVEAEML